MAVLALTPAVMLARAKWQYRGQARPPFAERTGPGEESVWDFPRPPRVEPMPAALKVTHGQVVVAQSTAGVRVVETAGAPVYYFPPDDVDTRLLIELDDQSLCEWKGIATSVALQDVPARGLAGWCYHQTFPEFRSICDWYAFHPGALTCTVGGETAAPQPGGYYGGWVTGGLKGPIKSGAGTVGW